MAGRVGHSGRVVGIDISEKMISLARDAAAAYDLPVSFRVGDLRNMDIPDASFDAVRIERTLQILDTPAQVMDESWSGCSGRPAASWQSSRTGTRS